MRRLQSRQPIGGEKEGCTFGRIDHATSLTIPSCSLLQFSCSPPPCNRGHPKQLWAASCTAWSLMQSGMEALKGNLSCYPSFGLVPNWNKQLFGHEKCIKYCENCQIMKIGSLWWCTEQEWVKVQKGRCHDVMQCRETSEQLILHLLENIICTSPSTRLKGLTLNRKRNLTQILWECSTQRIRLCCEIAQSFVSTTPVSSSYYIQQSGVHSTGESAVKIESVKTFGLTPGIFRKPVKLCKLFFH